jgi:hypothetical protein
MEAAGRGPTGAAAHARPSIMIDLTSSGSAG